MVYRFLCTLLHRAAESERGGSQGAAEEAEGQDSGGVAERVGQNTPQLGGTVSGSIAGSHSWLALQILLPSLSITQHIHTHICSHHTRKVQELWWKGLPPGVRGEVWKKAIGNELNISPSKAHRKRRKCVYMHVLLLLYTICATDLYQICLNRCKERLASVQMKSRSGESSLVY